MSDPSLSGQVALVTGASGGIGGAIALALLRAGARVHAVGRDGNKLVALQQQARELPGKLEPEQLNLTHDADVEALSGRLGSAAGRLDILVHSAGSIAYGTLAETPVERFDELYRANVRAPYLLTRLCLPLLSRFQGQIAFINSSTGLVASAGIGQFSATQHALKALADSLREEVNSAGVRVFSVFPGRTATARMVSRFELEGRPYRPELLLQPQDIASVVMASILLPRTAEVTNINIRPLQKSY